jgi:hypothetical protein
MSWLIPTVDATLHQLGEARYFTTLDVLSGFWHLPIKEAHRKYLVFVTKLAHYEFCKMPIGWNISPFHFQRYMTTRVADKEKAWCQVYIDDKVIFSGTEEDHFQDIDLVLKVIEKGVHVKMVKINPFQLQLEYLEHIITKEGIKKGPKKLAAIVEASPLRTKKQVRQFLGKTNYYAKFIPHLSMIAGHLAKLTSQSYAVRFT